MQDLEGPGGLENLMALVAQVIQVVRADHSLWACLLNWNFLLPGGRSESRRRHQQEVRVVQVLLFPLLWRVQVVLVAQADLEVP